MADQVGILIKRPDGTVKIGPSTFLFRRLGSFTIPANGPDSESASFPDLAQGKPEAIALPDQSSNSGQGILIPPNVTVSGTTISWTRYSDTSRRCGCLVIYGTY